MDWYFPHNAYRVTNQRRSGFSITLDLKSCLLREFTRLLCEHIYFYFTILFRSFSWYNKKRVTSFFNFMIDILYSVLFIVCFCRAIIGISNFKFILTYICTVRLWNIQHICTHLYTYAYILYIYVIFIFHRSHGHKICVINTRVTNQL